ncbi:MAG: ABC transporter ATP-binding protein [Clostridia bacterium]|nr:ABC transporter ATP-binding protein [Clostridia bacterium]
MPKNNLHRSKLDLTISQIINNFCYATKMMMKIYPSKFFCQSFFWIMANLLGFYSQTYMLRYVVNGVQEGENIRIILLYVFFMIIISLVIGSARAVYDHILSPIIDQRCERRLNLEIYRRSIEIDLENYENPESFDIYDRAVTNGADAISYVIDCIGGAISTLLGISMEAYLLFEIDPILFLFSVVPWLFSPLQMMIKKEQYEYDIEVRKINRRKDYTRRTFFQAEFAKEMRLTNLPKVMQHRFTNSIKDYLNLVKTKGLCIALLTEVTSIGRAILSARLAQIYSVFQTLVTGTMMYGDCLVAMRTVNSFSQSGSNIITIFTDIYSIALNIRDFRYFMENEPKVSSNPDGLEPVAGNIEFKNVSFRYDGANFDALKNVNMKIRQGEHVAIVGCNGAGKTTLIKLLMRLYEPTVGEICVDENNIRSYKLKDYRRTYGVVFQDFKQMACTVAENVLGRPYCDSDEKTVWDALKKAGISDVISKLPKGIQTVMTKEFDNDGLILSGGQSQKLAIASIYARNVDTVILDEPSSELDPFAENQMYENMLAASVGKTVIFISHRLSACVSADRVFYMEGGTITETGTHEELMKLCGKYAEMFRIQSENYTDN